MAKKTLLVIEGLIDVAPGIPDSFRSILRLRTAATLKGAVSGAPVGGLGTPRAAASDAAAIDRLAAECTRRFQQVALPPRSNCVEADLLRVHKMLQRVQNDPLRWELTRREQEFMWDARRRPLLTESPRMLSVALLAVPSWDADGDEARALLKVWQQLGPAEAIRLLDNRFWRCAQQRFPSTSATPIAKPCAEPEQAFRAFRNYAVTCMDKLDDAQLCSYMLQLALVLRHEEELQESALAFFLLRRALCAPFTVGHCVYWHVRAEMAACAAAASDSTADKEACGAFLRLGMFLRTYLNLSGEHEGELLAEELLVSTLRKVVKVGKEQGPSKEQNSGELMDVLQAVSIPPDGVRLPIDASFHVGCLVPEKCKVMSSATKPLMLRFTSFGSDELIGVIFKDGDDLRQDGVCLQAFGMMERLWDSAGLNVPLRCYRATDLGSEVGMLEMVAAETLSAISVSRADAGQSNVSAVFDIKKMAEWLAAESVTVGVSCEQATENFLRSCAGYCVATYVLGIGDRHNDNIMMQRDGHLVHIDFGYILGKNPVIPTPFGFTIDRYNSEVFAFLPDFGYIIGGENFKDHPNFERFQELCCDCYLVVRQSANLFLNLFSLMLPAGLYKEEELVVVRCPCTHCAATPSLITRVAASDAAALQSGGGGRCRRHDFQGAHRGLARLAVHEDELGDPHSQARWVMKDVYVSTSLTELSSSLLPRAPHETLWPAASEAPPLHEAGLAHAQRAEVAEVQPLAKHELQRESALELAEKQRVAW